MTSDARDIENLPVRMELARTGLNCKVQVQNVHTGEWYDLSEHIRRVTINAEVGEITTVTVEFIPYNWTANIEGVAGIVKMLPSTPETNGSETS